MFIEIKLNVVLYESMRHQLVNTQLLPFQEKVDMTVAK